MNHRHRKVLHGIFAHPVSANIAMKDIEAVVLTCSPKTGPC